MNSSGKSFNQGILITTHLARAVGDPPLVERCLDRLQVPDVEGQVVPAPARCGVCMYAIVCPIMRDR